MATAEELRAFGALDIAGVVGLSLAEVRAWLTVGRRKLLEGRLAAACDILAYACYLDVAEPVSWELLAAALLAAGRPREADSAIAAALALEPSWRRATLAGLCREAVGEEEEAERWREEARRLAGGRPEAQEVLRCVFGGEGGEAP
jgi:tetratricopeptide (TPR) repeat protein